MNHRIPPRIRPSALAAGILISLGLVLTGGTAAQADPVLRWSPSDAELAPGQQATLAVMLDDTLDVRTLELTVTFDPAVLTTVSGGPGALFDGFNLFPGFEESAPGQWYGYCVILGADDWATGPGELFTFTVEALAPGVSPLQTVEITLLPPGGGDYPETTLPDDQVRVLDTTRAPVPGAVAPRLSLAPNPFNPRTRLTLSLPRGGAAHVQVLNLRGELVARPWQGVLPAGRDVHVDWDGRGLDGRALPSGVYRFRLLGPRGYSAWQRGVLVR